MATQRPLISSASGQFQRLPTSDTLDLSTLGTGTPDNTKYLRGDGTWTVPPSEATSLALSSITAATGANTIASGDLAQTWQWALTSIVKSGLTLTESAASTNGGSSQVLLDIATVASSTAAPLRVIARGGESFRVNADGRVAIGTSSFDNTTGTDTLLVRGDTQGVDLGGTSSTGAVRIRGADNGGALVDFTKASTNPINAPYFQGRIFYDFNTNSLVAYTDSTERMRIDSVGNVGIGTNAPLSRIHTDYPSVEGTSMSQLKVNSALKNDTNNYDTVEKLIDVTTGAVGGLFIAPMARVGLHIDDLYCALGSGYKNGIPGGGLSNYGTYGVYVKGGGSNYFAGRVGIGVENPSVALDITGEIKENGYYVVTQADVGTGENQVPLNQHLGEMAFQSPESLVVKPAASATPANNGDMVFQLTSNTSLVIKVRGSDGVVRSATLTLA